MANTTASRKLVETLHLPPHARRSLGKAFPGGTWERDEDCLLRLSDTQICRSPEKLAGMSHLSSREAEPRGMHSQVEPGNENQTRTKGNVERNYDSFTWKTSFGSGKNAAGKRLARMFFNRRPIFNDEPVRALPLVKIPPPPPLQKSHLKTSIIPFRKTPFRPIVAAYEPRPPPRPERSFP